VSEGGVREGGSECVRACVRACVLRACLASQLPREIRAKIDAAKDVDLGGGQEAEAIAMYEAAARAAMVYLKANPTMKAVRSQSPLPPFFSCPVPSGVAQLCVMGLILGVPVLAVQELTPTLQGLIMRTRALKAALARGE
jgi:hypothetical protein